MYCVNSQIAYSHSGRPNVQLCNIHSLTTNIFFLYREPILVLEMDVTYVMLCIKEQLEVFTIG